MSARGAVAAGHPVTAEAGARVLREGGNAVDAAVAAALASFVTESPLTGLGAGGFMLIHEPGVEDNLLDFFVEVPGRGGAHRHAELEPVDVDFGGTLQTFNIGAASCGVPGTAAGLWEALERFGSVAMRELTGPAAELAREGIEITDVQAYVLRLLDPVLSRHEETRRLYAPRGRMLGAGETFRFGELADALERYGEEGPEPFYRGDVAASISEWVCERGGTLTAADLAAYEPITRPPVRAAFLGREIISNPPPSSGGLLIAFGLDVLERAGGSGLEQIVGAMEEAQAARTEDFHLGLYDEGYVREFLSEQRLAQAAARVAAGCRPPASEIPDPDDAIGSTTHITVVDGSGACATVTCSNGTGSGVLVPGTGVHVNNMLGEEDLNPLGFHVMPPGRRMTSMMAPSAVLRDGELELALGSGGSNRIRSAILQAIVHLIAEAADATDAVAAPRIHYEGGEVQAEPGCDERALGRLEARGFRVSRWSHENWFFGGVHAVSRDPATGELRGGGDPRRGGAVALA